MSENYFNVLNTINVNEHTDKKNGLTYLSWAWALAEVMKQYPTMTYTIWKDENNRPYIFDEALGYMVFTSVTIDGETKEMWLPVMDGANKAMKNIPYEYKVKNPNHKYAKKQADGRYIDGYGKEQPEYIFKNCEAATMFDINTAIMRCLVKNFAMFGLGLYIFAGEDVPEEDEEEKPRLEEEAKKPIDSTQINVISGMIEESGAKRTDIIAYVNKTFGKKYSAISELTKGEYAEVVKILQKKIDKKKTEEHK